MSFLKNTWYMAAWADELKDDVLLSRTIIDEKIVFYRDDEGGVHALADRCSHRFIPLSLGKRKGDVLQCPYHGLEYGPDGRCVHNPHGAQIPARANIRSYPVAEAGVIIWVWMGEPEKADPELIPDYSMLARAPATARSNGYLKINANYRLMTDNIMDLSHVDFLHANTLGGGSITRSQAKVTDEGRSIRIVWQVDEDVVPPAFASEVADPTIPTRQCTQVVWTPPSNMQLSVDIDRPGTDPLHTSAFHIMTPESAASTHYFFAIMRTFKVDDPEYNDLVFKITSGIFASEDKPMVEAGQQAMGNSELMDLQPLVLAPDTGALRARRRLASLIRAENGETVPVE